MTDQKKLEKLFKQHYRQMYRLATILLHDDAESKDVVHDIFARLLNDHTVLREETAESYLLTSVRNRCLNVIRSRQIQERVERLYLLDPDTNITTTDALLSDSEKQLEEELKALYEGIDLLEPPVCRDIIVQHFRDGITFKKIAFRMGVSETTVYKHLRRALSQLRTHLKKTMSV
jgi:RNA polymerase sigma-70 factor (ECF subfamily)